MPTTIVQGSVKTYRQTWTLAAAFIRYYGLTDIDLGALQVFQTS